MDQTERGDNHRHRRLWIGLGIGCLVSVAVGLFFVIQIVITAFVIGGSVVRGVGGFFLSSSANSESFLQALAEDDLDTALTVVHPSSADDMQSLDAWLPEDADRIAQVGEEIRSECNTGGICYFHYAITLMDGTPALAHVSMDIDRNRWLVSHLRIVTD